MAAASRALQALRLSLLPTRPAPSHLGAARRRQAHALRQLRPARQPGQGCLAHRSAQRQAQVAARGVHPALAAGGGLRARLARPGSKPGLQGSMHCLHACCAGARRCLATARLPWRAPAARHAVPSSAPGMALAAAAAAGGCPVPAAAAAGPPRLRWPPGWSRCAPPGCAGRLPPARQPRRLGAAAAAARGAEWRRPACRGARSAGPRRPVRLDMPCVPTPSLGQVSQKRRGAGSRLAWPAAAPVCPSAAYRMRVWPPGAGGRVPCMVPPMR